METSASVETVGRRAASKKMDMARIADNEENIEPGDAHTEFAEEPLMHSSGSANVLDISAEVRHHYVQVAAYYIAERRGLHGGAEQQDWVLAEAEIERMISGGRNSS
jgi:hypothetical protein